MKKILMITLFASAVLASCSNDEVPIQPVNTDDLQVKLADINTRAGLKTGFSPSDQIGIFVTGTGYTPSLISYTTTDTGNTWGATTAGTGIKLSGNSANVFGVYPAATTLSTPISGTSTFNVSVPTADNFVAQAATDYLWGTGTSVSNLNTTTCTTTLTMKHALSKVSFIINKSTDYPADAAAGKITGITLSSAGSKIVQTGTVTVGTGAFTSGSMSNSIALTPTGNTYINAYNATPSTNVIAYMLVAPVNYTTGDLALTITIDGKTMTVTNFLTAPDWSAYKDYQYTITVSPTAMVVTGVTITPWAIVGTTNLTAN